MFSNVTYPAKAKSFRVFKKADLLLNPYLCADQKTRQKERGNDCTELKNPAGRWLLLMIR